MGLDHEKLYEELLIGNNPQITFHKKIMKARDPLISYNNLNVHLDNLFELIEKNKVKDVKNLLSNLVRSYQPTSKIVDHFNEHQ